MDPFIRVKDQYYIPATSAMADDRTRVLKHGDTFAVFDRLGDIQPIGDRAQGLYHAGTRYLSRLVLSIDGTRPILLGSTVTEGNALLAVDLSNPDLFVNGQVAMPKGTLHVFRSKLLWKGVCYERLRVTNHGLVPAEVAIGFHFEADFADVFEVRGVNRMRRGRQEAEVAGEDRAILAYQGLDGVARRAVFQWSPAPAHLSASQAGFHVTLEPRAELLVAMTVSCEVADRPQSVSTYDGALFESGHAMQEALEGACTIHSSNVQLNAWLNRSTLDLHMLVTETAQGPFPYAGVPWFSTPFGRDGLITAIELLWVAPRIARGVLGFLSATQATDLLPQQDAEPGKIVHEIRDGEMAALGEIPFGRYYGSVDATALFVVLAGAYFERTGDRACIEALWPSLERALHWIDWFGDLDGDEFVEYARRSTTGLVHQGWKDSHDCISHEDGSLAEGPIALCEVQGYVYAAKREAARLGELLGFEDSAGQWRRQAEALRRRFEERFWCDDLGWYALALDGRKRPCRVVASNPGHCLWSGIVDYARAGRMGAGLLDPHLFSGWGIRTLASSEARYNPMSYHNGSVWPHDNALIAAGLARYGLKEPVLAILGGLFDAAVCMDLHRLPELFCGFLRRVGQSPTLYPGACVPQAWASASVFLLLQACLGLRVDAPARRVSFLRPLLPEFVQEMEIANLQVGDAVVDFRLRRHDADVTINVTRRSGDVEIITVK